MPRKTADREIAAQAAPRQKTSPAGGDKSWMIMPFLSKAKCLSQ